MSYDITDKNTEYFALDDEKAMNLTISEREAFGYTVTKEYLEDRDIYRLHYDIDETLPINKEILELKRVYDEGGAAIDYMGDYIDSPPDKKMITDALKPSKFIWILAIATLAISVLLLWLAFSFIGGAITLETFTEHVSVSIPEGSPLTEADLTPEFFGGLFGAIGAIFVVVFIVALLQIIRCYMEISVTYKSEVIRYEENSEYYEKRIEEIEDERDELFDKACDLVDIRDGVN